MRLVWLLAMVACHHGGAQPPVPSCADAAEHVRQLVHGERADKIHEALARRCTADGWSAEVRHCVVATRSLRQPRHCKAKLTAEQRVALDHDLATVDRVVAPAIPEGCRDYRRLIERLGACNAMAPAARAALEQHYREAAQQWTNAEADPRLVDAACRATVDRLRMAIAATCGW